MPDAPSALPLIDGLTLPKDVRAVLRPGETVQDVHGAPHVLPRWFYRVDSWEVARQVQLAPFFRMHEFVHVDLREAPVLRRWPRYVPVGVTALAAALSVLRQHFGTTLHLAANGVYRSPGHALCTGDDLVHAWGTAAQVFCIGPDLIDSEEEITRFGDTVQKVLPGVYVRPYGPGAGESDDHLHVSLGYLTLDPPLAP